MSERIGVIVDHSWRVESAGASGKWSRWGDVESEADARQYLDASRANNSDRVFRLVEIVTTETVLDA